MADKEIQSGFTRKLSSLFQIPAGIYLKKFRAEPIRPMYDIGRSIEPIIVESLGSSLSINVNSFADVPFRVVQNPFNSLQEFDPTWLTPDDNEFTVFPKNIAWYLQVLRYEITMDTGNDWRFIFLTDFVTTASQQSIIIELDTVSVTRSNVGQFSNTEHRSLGEQWEASRYGWYGPFRFRFQTVGGAGPVGIIVEEPLFRLYGFPVGK